MEENHEENPEEEDAISEGDDDDSHENEQDEASDGEEAVEPSYERANAVSFSKLADRLEKLYQLKVRKVKKRPSQADMLKALLPPQLLQRLMEPPPSSLFPILRLKQIPPKMNMRLTIRSGVFTAMQSMLY